MVAQILGPRDCQLEPLGQTPSASGAQCSDFPTQLLCPHSLSERPEGRPHPMATWEWLGLVGDRSVLDSVKTGGFSSLL